MKNYFYMNKDVYKKLNCEFWQQNEKKKSLRKLYQFIKQKRERPYLQSNQRNLLAILDVSSQAFLHIVLIKRKQNANFYPVETFIYSKTI